MTAPWLTEEEELKVLAERYRRFEADGFVGADKEIVDLLIAVRAMPGQVVPVWSCASHPELGDTSLYLAMAVDEQGFGSVYSLFSRYRDQTLDSGRAQVTLKLQRLLRCGHSDQEGSWAGLQFGVNFDYTCHTEKSLRREIKALVELAKSA